MYDYLINQMRGEYKRVLDEHHKIEHSNRAYEQLTKKVVQQTSKYHDIEMNPTNILH